MDMGGAQHDSDKNPDAAKAANDGMSDQDMDMGAHMFMTDLRPANAADEKRAAEILADLRPAIEKYKDYRVALADGLQIFLPNVPQKIYHFTNYAPTRLKPRFNSIRRIPLRCSIRKQAMATNWWARCIPLAETRRKRT